MKLAKAARPPVQQEGQTQPLAAPEERPALCLPRDLPMRASADQRE
jgi:hypothetical protein